MANNVTLIPKQPARHSLLTNVENIVYMPLASKHSHGIVKIGNGLDITSDGLLSIDFTKDWFVQVDNNIVALSNDVDYLKTANRDLSGKINSLTVEMSNVKANISELPNVYQKQNDLTLLTVNKTIVGGINELKTHTQTNSNDISAIELDLSNVKTSYATKNYVNSLYGTVSMGGHKSVVFDTRQEFVDWLDGAFTREDNLTPSLLNVGDMILIVEMGVPDYWVKFKTDPMTLADFAEYEAKIEIPEVTYDGISITKNQKGEFQAVALKDGFTKISDKITVSDFDGAVYLPVNSYKELLEYGSISVGDEQILFDNDTIYVTPYDEDQDIEELDNRVEILENNTLMTSDAIIFAESERQKSKNLLIWENLVIGDAGSNVQIDGNGQFSFNGTFYYADVRLLDTSFIKINQEYTFSEFVSSYTIVDGDVVFGEVVIRYTDGNHFVRAFNTTPNTRCGVSFTPKKEVSAIDIRFLRKNDNTSTLTGVVKDLMICEGTDTDYQPYNGPITHNNDAPVVFAESERQKSKNLYDKDDILLNKALSGSSGAIADNNNYFVSNDMIVKGLSNIVMSGGISSNDYFIFYDENFVMIGDLHRTGDNVVLEVPSNAVYARFECKIENANNNIQVESGLVATEYQQYNGAILHEKDIEALNKNMRGMDNFVDNTFAIHDDILTWIKNSAPQGTFVKYVNVSGVVWAYWILKASRSYASAIRFNYDDTKIQKSICNAGEWSGWVDIS